MATSNNSGGRKLLIDHYLDALFQYLEPLTKVPNDELTETNPLTKHKVHDLLRYFEIATFNRGTDILSVGEIDRHLNIVMHGIVSKQIIVKGWGKGVSKVGRLSIFQLATEGHFIHSDVSFNRQVPSEFSLVAIKRSILIRISRRNMNQLLEDNPQAEIWARALITRMAALQNERFIRLKLAPHERFFKFMTEQPAMLQRVSQKVIAAYLGIKQETFSRLKRKWMESLRDTKKGRSDESAL